MKIQSLEITDYPPIKKVKLENLGDIVIIAGANGSGKTRLKQCIFQSIQGLPQMSLNLKLTRNAEIQYFSGNAQVQINKGVNNQIMQQYIESHQHDRGEYVGSFVNIDANRDIKTISYEPVQQQIADPDEQASDDPGLYYRDFAVRWKNFMNYIHKKVAAYKSSTFDKINQAPNEAQDILEKNPYPLQKYKILFQKILPNKELQDIDPTNPSGFKYKINDKNDLLPFRSLSSGEQEAVKIVFDIARKDIKHSVIIFDEPELHLHPALTFKLIETLKTTGEGTNQFIFLTHSSDLISTYYSTGDVYFIDAKQTGENQAHKLSDIDYQHKSLAKLISNDLGLITISKIIIFVEGENASMDRPTYHAIAQQYLPEAQIVPVASVENIMAFNSIEQEIRNSLFGIDFYMIRDKDGLSSTLENNLNWSDKIKILAKRHIENYFLDSDIL